MSGYASSRPWRRTPLPRNWPALRRRILERDEHRCRIRDARCLGTATEVDHIGPADDHREENLQAVCGPCHRTKTGRANAARLNAHRNPKRPAQRHPGLLR